MYLTDLTDAQKNNIKGTVLMENWRSKYDFFLILDVIVYVDASGCLWGLLPEKYPKWQLVSAFPWIIRIYTAIAGISLRKPDIILVLTFISLIRIIRESSFPQRSDGLRKRL